MLSQVGIDKPVPKRSVSSGTGHEDRGSGLVVIGLALISELSRRLRMIHPERHLSCGSPSAPKPPGSHHFPEKKILNLLSKSDIKGVLLLQGQ